jgi:tRNA pseudouridine55 synthase
MEEPPRHAAPTGARRDVTGVLLFDKPVGESSNRSLQRVKRLFRANKAGHGGSLDPLASGMLPICLGEATKVLGFLLATDKVYRATAEFGAQTETGDAEGAVIAESEPTVTREALERALQGFHGQISQVPPMYSALKRAGRRLYRLARAGETIHRDARPVWIHEIEIERFDPHSPVLRVRCGSGTYIRTLVEDIARAAGRVAHLAALRRLSVGSFLEPGMVSDQRLDAAAAESPEALDALLLPADIAVASWPPVRLGAAESVDIRHGRSVCLASPLQGQAGGLLRLYDDQGRFMGIGELGPDGRLAPRRLLNLNSA